MPPNSDSLENKIYFSGGTNFGAINYSLTFAASSMKNNPSEYLISSTSSIQ
ncbi:hypothetical protein BH10BAC5_BH10BAC5_13400 [soil metagenome]